MNARLNLQHPSGDSVDLWFAQEDNRRKQNNVDKTSIPYTGPSETVLVNLEQEESVELSGVLPFRHVASLGGYSNDKLTAGAEWVQKVFSFVGAMGDGLTLTDNVFGRTQTCLITNFSWTIQPPEITNVRWTMQLEVGQGVGASIDRSPSAVSPASVASVGGVTLPRPSRVKEEISVETGTTPTPFADSPQKNIITEDGGAEHTIEYEGRVGQNNKGTFDSNMENLLGTDQLYTYSSAWPGTDYDVMVENYDPEDSESSMFEYTVEMIRGTK